MKKRNSNKETHKEVMGPTNRQLRAGENVRHILVNIIARGEIHDPSLQGISITIGEVRMSPDLKHANIFVSALGDENPEIVAKALNHAATFLRGQVARELDAKFTPKLRFIPDNSYDVALRVDSLLAQPHVQQDLERKHFMIDEDEEGD